MSEMDKVSRFLENAAKAAAGTSRAEDRDKLAMRISELVPAEAEVFCPGQTDIEKAVAPLLAKRVAGYSEASVTVEEVSAAVAETGSIICTSAAGKAVQASLLPSHHIAIVPTEKIFATLDDFFAANAAPPPTNITFITGPSRTADIELNLVIGVHGPEKLDVIVV